MQIDWFMRWNDGLMTDEAWCDVCIALFLGIGRQKGNQVYFKNFKQYPTQYQLKFGATSLDMRH